MENFDEIINGAHPVLVDFFATWCGPCKMMHPILEELHAKVGDAVRILTVDIDRNKRLAAGFRVKSVPTLMLFKEGELLWRASGVHSAADLQKIIAEHL